MRVEVTLACRSRSGAACHGSNWLGDCCVRWSPLASARSQHILRVPVARVGATQCLQPQEGPQVRARCTVRASAACLRARWRRRPARCSSPRAEGNGWQRHLFQTDLHVDTPLRDGHLRRGQYSLLKCQGPVSGRPLTNPKFASKMGFRSDETPIARARSHRTRLLASRRHAILLLLLRVPHEQTRVLIKRVLKLYPRTGSALEPFVATASHRWRAGHDQVWRWWRVRRQGLQLWLHVPKRARRLRSGCLSHPVCTSRRGRVVGRARSGCLGRRNPGRHSRRRRCRRRCRRCSAIRPSRRPSAASAERLLVLVAWCGRRRSVAQRRSHGSAG